MIAIRLRSSGVAGRVPPRGAHGVRALPGFRIGALSFKFAAVFLAVAMVLSCALIAGESTAFTFRPVHVFIDSGANPLAAYQIDFAVTNGSARVVGIEGGEHPAFATPPYYDPKAIQRERVIIAAFSTNSASALPVGKKRVATIHLQVRNGVEPLFAVRILAAADPSNTRIHPRVSVEPSRPQGVEPNQPEP